MTEMEARRKRKKPMGEDCRRNDAAIEHGFNTLSDLRIVALTPLNPRTHLHSIDRDVPPTVHDQAGEQL
jgi:hypothetical protein